MIDVDHEAPRPVRAHGVGFLALSLVLSLLVCAFLALTGLLGVETYEEWIGFSVGAGIYWLVFAGLQIWWWRKGCAKFWRPAYAYLLLAYIVLSIIALPLLLWPRFRRWLFRMTKPVDVWKPEDTIRRLAQLRDEGLLTADEFDAKKAELLAEVR